MDGYPLLQPLRVHQDVVHVLGERRRCRSGAPPSSRPELLDGLPFGERALYGPVEAEWLDAVHRGRLGGVPGQQVALEALS